MVSRYVVDSTGNNEDIADNVLLLVLQVYSVHVSFCEQVLYLASIGGRRAKPHIKAILGTLWPLTVSLISAQSQKHPG